MATLFYAYSGHGTAEASTETGPEKGSGDRRRFFLEGSMALMAPWNL